MGEKNSRLKRIRRHHPYCCFCGGTVPTETIEHAPPKVFFRDKLRLKGLEFPACRRCNNGSSQLDQVASFIALTMGYATSEELEAHYWKKLLRGVKNNTPTVIEYFKLGGERMSYTIKGRSRDLVKTPIDPRLVYEWLNPWGAKQAVALWFHHTGTILDESLRVSVNWVMNGQLYQSGVPDGLFEMGDQYFALEQGKKESSDQFFYKYSVNREKKLGIFILGVHDSAIIVLSIFGEEHVGSFTRPFQKGEVYMTSAETGIVAA